ncbi:acid phosphatase DET1 NDAI_0A05550 [Naumovozyma dairenensis CBS 421]|uniref:Uncharacterized protein n=1 Tax=Naumovozyma dairenensis (strain ATCC 10597 / BCRC 20456 / CBS 421 / NBRC 0211 / NRRL Y-12639) TaxID=1071378 RepID=G0W4H2_NAUDC|nr:hypothetical protein NDAI_0A05550 [Naumovozyma dairenensis CBS 421]CCD22710.1 hypothetical protein NDAI_0A05550 [Naumovozyma dairenensis CBS 421]
MNTYATNTDRYREAPHNPSERGRKPRVIVLIRHGESESNKDKKVNEFTPNHLIPLTEKGWSQARHAGVELLRILNLDNNDIVENLEAKYPLPPHRHKGLTLKDYKPLNRRKDRNIVFYTSPYTRTRETLKGMLDVVDEYNLINSGVHVCEDHAYKPCGKQKHSIWPCIPSGHYENNESTHCFVGGNKSEYLQYRVKDEPRIREQDFGNFQEVSSMQDVMKKRATYGHFFFRFPQGESAADVFDRVASFQETLFRHFEDKHSRKPRDVIVLVTHGIYARVFLMKWFRWTYEEFESFTNVPNGSMMVMELDETADRYKLRTVLPKWTE